MSDEVSYYENSKEIEKKIWNLLTNAVKDRSSEFRTPTFICGNDEDLDGRVVVLRKADQQNNIIQYHSDIRSSKIGKIKKNPNCSVLFYGKEEKIQLRIKAICEINYNNEVTKEESEAGYKNFCVIRCNIKSIEWLYLAAKGHRRALIDFNGSKKFTWLIP